MGWKLVVHTGDNVSNQRIDPKWWHYIVIELRLTCRDCRQEAAKAEVIQSLLNLRLMSLGTPVCRSRIQRDSLFIRSSGSPWWSWSTTTTLKSLRVSPSEQKWAATGFSLVFFRMSDPDGCSCARVVPARFPRRTDSHSACRRWCTPGQRTSM